jgi:hypothetical protein
MNGVDFAVKFRRHITSVLMISRPSKRDGYVATFNNVVVSYDGWIVHSRHCYAVINGGCKSVNSWSPPSNPIMKYDRVISIAKFTKTAICLPKILF